MPGDTVGMSPGYRAPGHIGIYLGSEVAGNTYSLARVDLRPLAEALGYECHYRVWEDGRRRLYVKKRALDGAAPVV